MRSQFAFAFAALAALSASPALASPGHAGSPDDWAKDGRPGDARKVTGTVEIRAYDRMRFGQRPFTVRRGETARIVPHDVGALPHELALGDEKSLREHAELVRRFPGIEHADPDQASVAPGKTGVLVRTFVKSGTIRFASLLSGR